MDEELEDEGRLTDDERLELLERDELDTLFDDLDDEDEEDGRLTDDERLELELLGRDVEETRLDELDTEDEGRDVLDGRVEDDEDGRLVDEGRAVVAGRLVDELFTLDEDEVRSDEVRFEEPLPGRLNELALRTLTLRLLKLWSG